MHNEFRRIKEDIDINDVEQIIKKILNTQHNYETEEADEAMGNLFEKYHKNKSRNK